MNCKIHRIFFGSILASIVLLCLLVDVSAQPTNVSFLPPPDWVRPIEWSGPAEPKRNEKSEGTRYLLFEHQENHQRREEFARIILLMENESGVQDSGSLRFNFDPSYQELILHRAQIHRGGKLLDRLDKSKVKVIQSEPGLDGHLFTGKQTALLFVEDLRVGDALEYACTTRGSNPILGDHYSTRFVVQSSMPVDHQRMRVVWASAKPLHLRSHLTDLSPKISPWNGGTEYTWDFTNLTAIAYEDDLPASHEPYPYVELSDFDNWARVVEWALPLYSIENTNMPPELQELIAQWQNRESSDEERARSALQFVQDELRYTGLELGPDSYRPAHPFETFQKRFGDCKGKVSLLCAMLHAMKIEAHPALVNSSVREAITRRLPSPFAFDHVIVKLAVEGRTVWVDPTISHQGGMLWDRHVPPLGKALVIQRGVTSLEDVPTPRGDGAQQQVTSTIRIKDYKSPAAFAVKTTYRASGADNMREEIARTDPQELAKRYLNYYARHYPGVEGALPLEVSDDRKSNVLTVSEHYQIRDLWILDKSSKQWKAEFYAENLQRVLTDPTTRFRTMPLRLSFPLRREQENVVQLPESNWSIPDLEKSLEHEAFTFHYQRKFSGSTVRFQYACETKTNQLPAEKVAGYLAKLEEMEDLLGDSLQRPDDSPRGILDRMNWLMAVIAVFGLTATLAGSIWIWRATHAPNDIPPPLPGEQLLGGLGGWLILVGIGLCIGPITRIVGIGQHWEGFFSLPAWQTVAVPGGGQYHPLYAPLLIFEVLGNCLLLGINVLTICLFFAKRAIFPKAYIMLVASNVVFLLIDELVGNRIPLVAAESGPSSFRDLFRGAASALLWSAYMLKSRRVKATFVR
jgi:hypothetical protein